MSWNGLSIDDELFSAEESQKILSNPAVAYDLVAIMMGKKLGSGCYRAVYECNAYPTSKYVIKIEPGSSSCNVVEAAVWNEVKWFTGEMEWVKKWFAPVEWISPNGKILCMHKTIQKPNKKKPDKVPTFLSDIKEENFGWIGNNYVCHDYGQLWNLTKYNKGFKKAKWY